jgi:hydroxypyruvate reductase
MNHDAIVSDIKRISLDAIRAAHAGDALHRVLGLDGRALLLDRGRGSERFSFENGRLFVVGAGKAAAAMALTADCIFGELITDGVIAVKDGHTKKLSRIRQYECSHPVPDARGAAVSRAMHSLVASAGKDDLILCLLTGGASSLTPFPADGISLEDKRCVTDLLLTCGAPISDVNCVRKHLSQLKGGFLARAGFPARMLVLCVSDVVGDDFSVIGSGPFFPDSTTYSGARAVLERYDLVGKTPPSVIAHIMKGAAGASSETPKPGEPCFENTLHHIVVSNTLMIQHAASTALSLGYEPVILSGTVEGDTSDAAIAHVRAVRRHLQFRCSSKPLCLISGGETTVHVTGKGKGGRNTEFVLRAALASADIEGLFISSVGSDGTDGPTDAAGAWMSTEHLAALRVSGIDPQRYADDNDAYTFMRRAGTLIATGPTDTNVLDLRLMIAARRDITDTGS